MQGVAKKFDQSIHDATDAVSKEAMISFFRELGLPVEENLDKYGVDLVVPFCEIEQRAIWSGDTFPYETVHIPSRKSKFMLLGVKYAVLNKELNRCLITDTATIKRYAQVEVRNNLVSQGEYFYDVPLKEFSLLNLETNKFITMTDEKKEKLVNVF